MTTEKMIEFQGNSRVGIFVCKTCGKAVVMSAAAEHAKEHLEGED